MNANTARLFLFLLGGIVILAGGGYIAGVFDRFLPQDTAAVAHAPANSAPSPAAAPAVPGSGGSPAVVQDGPSAPPAADANPSAPAPGQQPSENQPAEAAGEKKGIPTFDLVRLEPDGSLIVAGQALPAAKVEVVSGVSMLGENVATPGGDFAVILDDPLAPGDYTLVLRATNPDGTVLTSLQSAIVSVPERKDGDVLVMVEQPGEASKILTVPQPTEAASVSDRQEAATGPADDASPQPPAAEGQPAVAGAAPAKPAGEAAPATRPEEGAAAPAKPPVRPTVTIEAVEIEGQMVFVAGSAEAKRQVRAYANEILLGQTTVSDGGRFLVEASRSLPVGEYVIRVDVLGPDGTTVIARAAVPFQREPGEQIAAVAPPAEQASPAVPGVPAIAGKAPAEGQPAAPGEAAVDARPSSPPPSGAPGGNNAAAMPETTAPKLQSAAGSVIIRRGDTLWRISRRVYGMGVRYSTIYLANQDQIADPNRIWPGQIFSVPRETDAGEPADMSTIADQVKND